ncbi:MAG: hypothetical protein IKQ07_06765 [Bacteroidaceae bacterium]|nr:hypothetical protein [Bacteroidaceae bacterium]
MANIKNLQMWKTICADARIGISKSLFGLRSTAIYLPSNSVIDAKTTEYSVSDGEHLKRLFETPRENLSKVIGDFHPIQINNGNFMAELCCSRDGAYLAIQLFQFVRLKYEPATNVLIFEGDDARAVKQLFA